MKSYERRLECWQCLRCDHLWVKRPGDRPVTCPGCKNKLWAVTPTRKPGAGRKKKECTNPVKEFIRQGHGHRFIENDPICIFPSRPIQHEGDQNVIQ